MKSTAASRELVVAGLHPLLGQRAGVLDASGCRRRWPMQWMHAAGPEYVSRNSREVFWLRIVRQLGFLLGVEVVQVAEELVEAVHRSAGYSSRSPRWFLPNWPVA